MTWLGLAVTAAMAAVLLWAALEKARNVPAFAAVLRLLGMPERGARGVAAAVIMGELGVALSLIFRPQSPITLIAVLGVAAAFAFCGLLALGQQKVIHCGCFGPYGDGNLGRPQLVAFPFWLGGVGLLWLCAAGPVAAPATSLFAVVALTMALVRGVTTVRAARSARGDRQSAQEMYQWLNR